MPLSDLSSLLQLAVGANLGFGALDSFYEPLSVKTERSLSVIDEHLEEINGRLGSDANAAAKSFQITQSYSELALYLCILQLGRILWEGSLARTLVLIDGHLSFLGLFVVSLAADVTSETFFVVMAAIAVATNLPPLVFGASMWIVAFKHERQANPRVERIENQLYKNFIRRI
ncbi:hypothetical protein XH98_34005 [Bradyrhizobium sp. CCBAU 51745]|uniref:hypothetical protein n=2 Tax=unclassified Bradyrhizobium TaxID=2631580 RepID=UPI002306D176|nr:hypothetical protein [Bradyrhizobium sp. CCBAU 51745]MDA9444021.1 hypothetical protein [Bradyrhizobium sp. CCBAU 51745]